MIVREATLNDLPALRVLAIRVFTITFETSNDPADFKSFLEEAYSEEKISSELLEVNSIYFVAEDAGSLVGYSRVRENNEVDHLLGINHLELQRLYVDVPYQGRGVANALLGACEKVAQQRGKEWIWLGVWEHNPKAIHYYQKQGYERFSQHDFLVGADKQTDLLMRKKI